MPPLSDARQRQLEEARQAKRAKANKENAPATAHARRIADRLGRTQSEVKDLREAVDAAKQCADTHRRRADRWEARAEEARSALRARESDPARVAELEATVLDLQGQLAAVKLRAQAQRKRIKSLELKISRAEGQKRRAVLRAEKDGARRARHFVLNRGNFVPFPARLMILQLSVLGLAASKVSDAVHLVAAAAGYHVKGTVSERTVRRIVDEGGKASEMQLAEELTEADNVTLSSDGTTDHSLQYTAHHAAISKDGEHSIRFVGVSLSENHTVATQLRDWKGWLNGVLDTLNRSPRGQRLRRTIYQICERIKGFTSDHSADMKALNTELFDWISDMDRVRRGMEELDALSAADYAAFVLESYAAMIEEAGGLAAWDMLSFEERNRHWQRTRETIARERGRTAFSKLSPEQQDTIDLWFWSGCCMHKELNSVVGGYSAMSKFWAKSGLVAPMKLMNKDNSRAADSTSSDKAKERAEAASTGGAVKFLQLLAALVRHKDKKKGHQDIFKEFFATLCLYDIEFPDVSNTRFQSYCDAAAFVLLHLDALYEFMEHIRDNKVKAEWNHMEENVWHGMRDIPTRTELAVLAYYGQSVGHPYVARTRIHGLNAMDLGPIHDEVKAHCKAIAECPSRLTAPHCSHALGCLGGAAWDQSEVIYCLQKHRADLPHLDQAVSAFFEGAHETWVRFTSEYTPDGAIANASAADRANIFLPATNDHNEAAVGWLRVFKQLHPNARVEYFNALTRCARNGTAGYIKDLDEATLRWLMQEIRRLDVTGRKRRERAAIIPYQRTKVQEKRLAMEKSAKRKRDLADRLETLLNGLDRTRLKFASEVSERMTVAQIDAELEWHRHRGAKDAVPRKKDLKRKADKLEALKRAIDAYNSVSSPETEWFGIEDDPDEIFDDDTEEEASADDNSGGADGADTSDD